MQDQYKRIKRDHQGDVLFFRLGDFYEMFSDDALEVSALLNLTLTNRNGVPMCGIPYHAARSYIARLLKFGKKIAICEQLTEAGKGRGIIERKVVEVITPGTTVDEDFLEKGNSNYLGALAGTGKLLSFAYIDLSTGEFHATSFPYEEGAERLRQDLERLQLRELVAQESLLEESPSIAAAVMDRPGLVVNRWADWLFDLGRGRERLERQFGTASLKGFGLEDNSPEILSAGAVLDYLDDTAKSLIPHVRSVTVYGDSEYLGIDESTQRNLELVRNLRDGDLRFSLLEVMDETKTAMGRRLLKRRILHPLRDLGRIKARLDMVEALYRDQGRLTELRELLGKTPDLERLCSRLAMEKAHAKDLLSIRNALTAYKAINELGRALNCGGTFVSFESASTLAANDLARLMGLRDLLEKGILDDPSILLTEGKLIRDGYNTELDELHKLRDNGRFLLEKYLEEERLATGISSLKIRYNRLIGYFFEVTKAHLSKVPPYFIRRQGIVQGERFSTDRLAGLESDINGASDRVVELEKKLFLEIRDQAKALIAELAAAAAQIAELDAAQSLARAATVRGWVRPLVDAENRLEIREGRHPVVEAHLPGGEFIPNDVILEEGGVVFALITGPNMAGKSTYLRQAALIAIMAQSGSFVPAREAKIGVTDRIYCRVGASDNLARGESTFLVEMNETAHILNTATERSMVIMDEVGRGTGTYDGLSIAWAVCEELLDRIKCRTLFATHYHELALLSHPHLANRSMEVLNQGGEIVFLRKLKEGPAAESYGLHVARLAGLSEEVLRRAAEIMDRLKEGERVLHSALPQAAIQSARQPEALSVVQPGSTGQPARGTSLQVAPEEPARDAALTPEAPKPSTLIRRIAEDIAAIDLNRMTPLEALNRIHTWKALFDGKDTSRHSKAARDNSAPSLFDE
ncbi:DNA mismatch repair protein MutS [Treponema primitia]|uniref:DNA mismatch repair protein MutS n=1 Tax=Treponema primitia TaxID=88058 RepID=UPI0009DA3DC0|nr:DNA mismatch repair protein MutS [Treponema primitia]